jgi:antitoxin component YwqK of YwqJK toxin-antitoxin module
MMYLGAPVLAQETELHELTFVEFGALKAGDDGLQYTSGKGNPFTGVSIEFYPHGTKRNIYTWKDGQENGLHTVWHEDTGLKKQEVQYSAGRMDGIAIEWHTDGHLKSLEHYAKGKKHGLFLSWHPNGQLSNAGFYEEDQPSGLNIEKAPDGALLKEILYRDGKLLQTPKKD